jgi:ferredoxin-NADP reductase
VSKTVHPEHRPRLISARDLAPGVRLFRFASWPGFSFVPGQFLMFHFQDDPKTWRAYSVCSAVADQAAHFEVAVGMVGAFSDRLGALKPGEEDGLVVRGPFGRWTWDGTGHAVLIGGGTGVTPFRAMALLGRGRFTLFQSAKTRETLLWAEEHDAWRKNGRVEEIVTSERKRITPGEILSTVRDETAVFYICGPKTLVEEMRNGLALAGVPPARIRTERWGDYADLF